MSLAELQSLERDYAIPTYVRNPVQFVRGSGARLWDAEGNEYLDFLAGISVLNVGHCHPRVVEAVREQAGRLTHVSNLYYTEPAMKLSAALSESSLGRQGVPVQLGRRGERGGDQARPPGAAGRQRGRARRRVPRPDLRRAVGHAAGVQAGAVRAARARVRGRAEGPGARCRPRSTTDTAAVLLEPIQGETGIHVLSDELLHAAREACDRTGAALVFDEIQTGMGRTGTLWAYEQTDVVPDALTSAKALGGGLPIGALVTGPRLADALQPGDHGSTFAGGPVVGVRRARRARDLLGSGAARAGARRRRAARVRARGAAVRRRPSAGGG